MTITVSSGHHQTKHPLLCYPKKLYQQDSWDGGERLHVQAALPEIVLSGETLRMLLKFFGVRRARDSSLGVKGARIFNLLPAWIRTRNGVSVSEFKSELDIPASMSSNLWCVWSV